MEWVIDPQAPDPLQRRSQRWSKHFTIRLARAGLSPFPVHTLASRQWTTNHFERPPTLSSSWETFLFPKLLGLSSVNTHLFSFYSHTFPYHHLMYFVPSNKPWSSWSQTNLVPPLCAPRFHANTWDRTVTQSHPRPFMTYLFYYHPGSKFSLFDCKAQEGRTSISEKCKWLPARVSFTSTWRKQPHLGCDLRGFRNTLPLLAFWNSNEWHLSPCKVLNLIKIRIGLGEQQDKLSVVYSRWRKDTEPGERRDHIGEGRMRSWGVSWSHSH